MLDLDPLRSFVSLVDMGVLSALASVFTAPTVSQQIQRLEEAFGGPLLHRDVKQIRPTEEGERLLS